MLVEGHHSYLHRQGTSPVKRTCGEEDRTAALLASILPAYLWSEVYMAMCHAQNIVPNTALQRELKKKKNEQLEQLKKGDGEEGAAAQAAADLPEVLVLPVRGHDPLLGISSRRHG